jgi:hypothetical protein
LKVVKHESNRLKKGLTKTRQTRYVIQLTGPAVELKRTKAQREEKLKGTRHLTILMMMVAQGIT